MYSKVQFILLLILQIARSKPSIKDYNVHGEISAFLEDYFNWKIHTYKFSFYIQGEHFKMGQTKIKIAYS